MELINNAITAMGAFIRFLLATPVVGKLFLLSVFGPWVIIAVKKIWSWRW